MTTPAPSTRAATGVVQKVCVWLIFGAVFGVLPLVFRGLDLGIRGSPFSWPAFSGDGELFVSSCAIAAGAMGDLVFAEAATGSSSERFFRALAVGLSLILCVCNSVGYLVARSAPVSQYVAEFSLALFGGTVVVAATCVGLAVER